MGLVLTDHYARIYEAWYKSPLGKAMDRWMEEFFLQIVDAQAGERVLEVGCGHGNHLLFLMRSGLDATGIDASPQMIQLARGRLGKGCSLKTARAEDLPFDDNEFDLVVFINSLEFFDNPLQALREAGRVARKAIFIGVINSLSWYGMLLRCQGLFRGSLFRHLRFYSLWDLKSYMHMALGDVPLAWACTHLWPPVVEKWGSRLRGDWNFKHCPFGSFLGISAKMVYHFRTDNLPLELKIKKSREPVVSGLTVGSPKSLVGSANVKID